MQTFDVIYKILSLIIGLGMLTGIARLAIWAIRLEPRVISIETEAKSHGTMIQQLTATTAHLEGMMEGSRKDGTGYDN